MSIAWSNVCAIIHTQCGGVAFGSQTLSSRELLHLFVAGIQHIPDGSVAGFLVSRGEPGGADSSQLLVKFRKLRKEG